MNTLTLRHLSVEEAARYHPDVPPTLRKHGLVEEYDVNPDGLGGIRIRRTVWTRIPRRTPRDQRGDVIDSETLLRLNEREVHSFAMDFMSTLATMATHGR